MTTRPYVLCIALLLASPAVLRAQVVRGTFVDHDTGEPIRGAHVTLRAPDGTAAASTNTDAGGAFEVKAPAAGTYTLRGDRIGFAPTLSPALSLSPGETATFRLVGSSQRVMLAAITVQAGARCETRPAEGRQTATLWEEARKALLNAKATAQARLYQYTAQRVDRRLDPRTGAVVSAKVDTTRGMSGNPYVSVPGARLAEEGYVVTDGDTLDFRAPDAGALLSDEFLDQHCFRVKAPPAGQEALIGLAFEPVRDRRLPDVQGTLWIDRQTAELRRMEYAYANAPLRTADEAGGEMDFRRLPSGSWIVSRWRIRMPLVTPAPPDAKRAGSTPLDVARLPAYRLIGYQEQGGELTAIYTRGGAPVSVTAGAQLAGVVFDSTRSVPLRGAKVRIDGTQYTADADSAGRFTFRDLPDGTFNVTFSGPRLDSLGYAPQPVRVSLARGATTRQDLAVPGMARVLAAGCGDSVNVGAVLAGSVRADSTGEPVVGAHVTAAWEAAGGTPAGERMAISDFRGVYRLCGAPSGVPVTVRLATQGTTMSVSALRLAADRPSLQDFLVPRPLLASAAQAPAPAAGIPLHVRVTAAETGQPLSGATVRLGSALAPQTTDARGGATFPRVAAGTYLVTVADPQLGTRTVPAVIGADGPELELRVPAGGGASLLAVVRSPVRLAALTARAAVRGTLAQVGFEQRKRLGIGSFISGADLERHGNAPLSSIFRYIPGVRVVDYYPPSTLRRGRPMLEHRIQPTRGGGDAAGNPGCFMSVFMDGVLILDGSPEEGHDVDANLLANIKAVEVYRSMSEIPTQFRGTRSLCGVVVLWTKTGEDDRAAASASH